MTNAKLPVLINAGGGRARREGGALIEALQTAFADSGVTPEIDMLGGDALAERMRSLGSSPVVAVGGGDGTLGSAAALLAGSETALAVLPLGTLNHFSKELGFTGDLGQAARAAVGGSVRAVDLGQVGDRVFLNNASIGIYSRMVRLRDRSWLPKWIATVPAALNVLRHIRLRPMTLTIDGTERCLETPLLFVGNNRYALSGASIGQRESLSDGILSLYAVRRRGPLGLVWFGLRAMVGMADPQSDFEAVAEAREVTVAETGSIDVAHDGEVTRMTLPLTFKVLPGALRVMMPAEAA